MYSNAGITPSRVAEIAISRLRTLPSSSFSAEKLKEGDQEQEVGVCRYIANVDGQSCEFALVVADAWQKRGIGNKLMNCLFEIARVKGLKMMEGEVLVSNRSMLELVCRLGFDVLISEKDDSIKRIIKQL